MHASDNSSMTVSKSLKGFSLIELLVVIAIIGICAGIAVPFYLGQRTKAAQTEATSNLQALRLLLEQRYAENGCYATGNPVACTNTTLTGVLTIQGNNNFPNFRPGNNYQVDDLALKFTYQLKICGNPNASAFTAYATGKSGTPVYNSKFWVDQNNSMNAAAPPCP